MLRFKQYYNRSSSAAILEMVMEANELDASGEKQQNKEGVLHELMVRKALIDKHGAVGHDFNDSRENADDAYHRISSDLYGADYQNHPQYQDALAKAVGAADTIRQEEGDRWKPGTSRVAWTSKHGDVENLTGVPSTQKGDSSDLYIHNPHLTGDDAFGGYSLKKTDKKNIHPPVSNGGRSDVDRTLGVSTDHHVNDAKEQVYQSFPHLRGMTAAQAKEQIKSNPQIKAAETKARSGMLKNIASTWADSFQGMDNTERASWLREAMRANPTGFRHNRVTSGGTKGDFSHMISNPVTEHDQYLNDPDNIRTEVSSNSVRFIHKHPTTGTETPLLQIRAKSAGSAGIFSSTKTSGEHFKMPKPKKDKSVARVLNTNDPIQSEVQTQHISDGTKPFMPRIGSIHD